MLLGNPSSQQFLVPKPGEGRDQKRSVPVWWESHKSLQKAWFGLAQQEVSRLDFGSARYQSLSLEIRRLEKLRGASTFVVVAVVRDALVSVLLLVPKVVPTTTTNYGGRV